MKLRLLILKENKNSDNPVNVLADLIQFLGEDDIQETMDPERNVDWFGVEKATEKADDERVTREKAVEGMSLHQRLMFAFEDGKGSYNQFAKYPTGSWGEWAQTVNYALLLSAKNIKDTGDAAQQIEEYIFENKGSIGIIIASAAALASLLGAWSVESDLAAVAGGWLGNFTALSGLFIALKSKIGDQDSVAEQNMKKLLKIDPEYIDMIDDDLLARTEDSVWSYISDKVQNAPNEQAIEINDIIQMVIAKAENGRTIGGHPNDGKLESDPIYLVNKLKENKFKATYRNKALN